MVEVTVSDKNERNKKEILLLDDVSGPVVLRGSSAKDIVAKLRLRQFVPDKSNTLYMERVANRAATVGGMFIVTRSAVDFLESLDSLGLIEVRGGLRFK